jgi:hypothetical protein
MGPDLRGDNGFRDTPRVTAETHYEQRNAFFFLGPTTFAPTPFYSIAVHNSTRWAHVIVCLHAAGRGGLRCETGSPNSGSCFLCLKFRSTLWIPELHALQNVIGMQGKSAEPIVVQAVPVPLQCTRRKRTHVISWKYK